MRYFATPVRLRQWFTAHHADTRELLIAFYKKATGKPSVTYHEALDEALCVGWIDGVRKRVDEESYTVRFTPRRAGSYWSAVNTTRAKQLTREGRMRPAGVAAFKARDPEKTKRYSFEREAAALAPAHERLLRANKAAWACFQKEPPSRRKAITWWIASAKKEETRVGRVKALVTKYSQGHRLM